MTEHTPGPWWIDEDGDYLCICEGDVNEFGEREEVALLHCNRPSLKATQPANACLIAAAPELLAALKAHIPWKNAGQPEKPPQGWGIWQDAIDAINKAEGRGE
jgi:hypothetical protein